MAVQRHRLICLIWKESGYSNVVRSYFLDFGDHSYRLVDDSPDFVSSLYVAHSHDSFAVEFDSVDCILSVSNASLRGFAGMQEELSSSHQWVHLHSSGFAVDVAAGN